jgi:hypothetical protein
MRRLAIAAVGLALVVALALGAGAFSLYVWPRNEQKAPTLSPRYTYEEAIGLVRARLPFGAKCHTAYGFDQEGNWGALFDRDHGVWWVEVWCGDQKEPRMDDVWRGLGTEWHMYEDSGQVIPMTDNAAAFMGQTQVVLQPGQ